MKLLDILRNLIYSLKPNIFCPIFVSSSQRLAKVASPPLPESTVVDSKNLPRKSLIFLSKAGYARCLLPWIAVLGLTAGCFSRSTVMTRETFGDLLMGTPVATLEAEAGSPYSILNKGNGVQEYEYIERIDLGNALVAENHYYIVVKEGKVVGKHMCREKMPAYDLIYQEDPNHDYYPNP